MERLTFLLAEHRPEALVVLSVLLLIDVAYIAREMRKLKKKKGSREFDFDEWWRNCSRYNGA